MLLRLAVAAAVVLALAACGSKQQTGTRTTALPPGCDVPTIEAVVTGFFDAANRGDAARLRGYLAPTDFGTYTVASEGFSTSSTAKALAYLARRHAAGEHVRLLALRVRPGTDANHVEVQVDTTRVARDFPKRGITNRLARVTGTVNCVSRSLSSWDVLGP